ncbi:hypothetical protein J2X72_004341 [Phyllobacterium sp. 1468]|nr:hypothetical protein [Phyllobacterium sp. 1468]
MTGSSSKLIRIGSLPAYNLAFMHFEDAVSSPLGIEIYFQVPPSAKNHVAGTTVNQSVVLHVIRDAKIDRSALRTFQVVIEALVRLTTSQNQTGNFTLNFRRYN